MTIIALMPQTATSAVTGHTSTVQSESANAVINNVEKVPDPALSDQRKMEIKGEASFIRAMMYFQAVQLWGDVPLQLIESYSVSVGIITRTLSAIIP